MGSQGYRRLRRHRPVLGLRYLGSRYLRPRVYALTSCRFAGICFVAGPAPKTTIGGGPLVRLPFAFRMARLHEPPTGAVGALFGL